MPSELIAVLIGLAAGVSGGLFGIGGGLIIVPALVLFLGMTQHKAQGTSLAVLLAPVGLFGVLNYAKESNVDWKIGAWIAGAFLIGALGGSKLAINLNEDVMRKSFAVFLIVVGAYLLFRK